MTIWTVAAEEGVGGERVAAQLALAADVPFFDRTALAQLAHQVDPKIAVEDLAGIDRRVGGRLATFALGMATATLACSEVVRELRLRETLPKLGKAVLAEAARQSCVICTPVAFAALDEHPGAVHVRLRAPFAWRVERVQREELVDKHGAERRLRQADHDRRALVKCMYRVDLDDESRFSLVLDASRFTSERMVEILLAAGARTPVLDPESLTPLS